jgi:hypothetical protein
MHVDESNMFHTANKSKRSQRNHSFGSSKSLGSYQSARRSLSQMHQYVDKLFKEVNSSKVLDRSWRQEEEKNIDEVSIHASPSQHSSQNLEAINEIVSETEYSFKTKQEVESLQTNVKRESII